MTTANETGLIQTRHQYFNSDAEVLKAAKDYDLTVIRHGKCWHVYGPGVDVRVTHLRAITRAELEPLVATPQAVRRSRHA